MHTAKLGAPLVESGLAKTAAAAKFLDWHACFGLIEEADDLLIGKSCGLNIRNSPKFADLLLLPWYSWQVAGHLTSRKRVKQATSSTEGNDEVPHRLMGAIHTYGISQATATRLFFGTKLNYMHQKQPALRQAPYF